MVLTCFIFSLFFAGSQLARKWQKGWLPFSRRKMRFFKILVFVNKYLSRGVHLALSTKLARNLKSVEKASTEVSVSMTSKDNKDQ